MNKEETIHFILKKSKEYGVILKKHIVLNSGVDCLIFASYCPSDLFYKHFFKVAPTAFKVNNQTKRLGALAKKQLKQCGIRKVWTKGVFSVYGDLRPLAKMAGFGDYGSNGIIENDKLGSEFLLTAIFFK